MEYDSGAIVEPIIRPKNECLELCNVHGYYKHYHPLTFAFATIQPMEQVLKFGLSMSINYSSKRNKIPLSLKCSTLQFLFWHLQPLVLRCQRPRQTTSEQFGTSSMGILLPSAWTEAV
jgi:hypothetical protein